MEVDVNFESHKDLDKDLRLLSNYKKSFNISQNCNIF